ncbi:hypothetical protein R1flu_016810 [Riccia fluitans]|uniref:Uncharacterized protein n=1 Tax=Riccia fluitans TaxID=41844 RepID=A0ABD1YQZ9_9MARC
MTSSYILNVYFCVFCLGARRWKSYSCTLMSASVKIDARVVDDHAVFDARDRGLLCADVDDAAGGEARAKRGGQRLLDKAHARVVEGYQGHVEQCKDVFALVIVWDDDDAAVLGNVAAGSNFSFDLGSDGIVENGPCAYSCACVSSVRWTARLTSWRRRRPSASQARWDTGLPVFCSEKKDHSVLTGCSLDCIKVLVAQRDQLLEEAIIDLGT